MAFPGVAVEPVAGLRVADDLVRDGRPAAAELGPEALDVLDRYRLVEVAEQPEPRRLEVAGAVDEGGEQREAGGDDPTAVEADGGAERAGGGDEERDPSAQAEADDAVCGVPQPAAARWAMAASTSARSFSSVSACMWGMTLEKSS